MPAVPRAHTAIPGRHAEQLWPSTPPGAPRRALVRQDRWHRRGAASQRPTAANARGRRTGCATPPGGSGRHDAQLEPGGFFHPDQVTGARTHVPPDIPKTCRQPGSRASRRAALRQVGPGRARALLIPRPALTHPIRRMITTPQGYVPFRINHALPNICFSPLQQSQRRAGADLPDLRCDLPCLAAQSDTAILRGEDPHGPST
jgi:hypothetical protein